MADTMEISEYLSKGGRLTNPANVPTRYRAELMKIMATFVDSELAGAAGFADVINAGPGIKERIAAAGFDGFKFSFAQWVIGHCKRKLCDDDIAKCIAGNINALPKTVSAK